MSGPATLTTVLLDLDAAAGPPDVADVVVRRAARATGAAAERLVADGASLGVAAQRGLDAARGPVAVLAQDPAALDSAALRRLADAFARQPALGLVGLVGAGGLCAVRLSALPPGGPDVAAQAPAEVVADLARRVRSGGSLALDELPLTGPAGGERLLVVHARVPVDGRQQQERLVMELLQALAALWPAVPVTLLAAEHAPPGVAAPWQALGVEVVTGPRDWEAWFADGGARFTTVVLSGSRMEHRFAALLDAHQPQASRVLLTGSLPFRSVQSMEPALRRRDEVRGLHGLAGLVRERTVVSVDRVDAVWCTSPLDVTYVTGLHPARQCLLVPDPAVRDHGEPRPREVRRGLVVLASPGADSLAGHEDAALLAARAVLPVLRARDGEVALTVLADRPSPAVLRLAEEPGVELASWAHDGAAALAGARVALAPYAHGEGATLAAGLATAAGTPWVGLSAGCGALDLGPDRVLFARDGVPGLVERTWQLLRDDAAWDAAAASLAAQRERGGRLALRRFLVDALAGLGVPPPAGGDLLPDAVVEVPRPPDPAAPEPMLPLRADLVQQRPEPAVIVRGWPGPQDPDEQYARWLEAGTPGPARLEALAAAVAQLADPPVISIVVPTYDSEPAVLEDTLRSVEAQVYPHWQLCVADDASPREDTREVLRRWAARDARVRLDLRTTNSGISGASNAALALATGDFVAFLDHDDLLKPHALAEVALRLAADPELDMVYSDEDKLDEDGRLVEPFFKPDWSPEQLMSRNYVGHLMVLRRSLVEKTGGFREGYDGSQDHDLLLRFTELTQRIAHVPEPLYTWRRVPGSTAAVVDAKPYAFTAAKRALGDALARRGMSGRAVDGLLPSTYRVRYDVVDRPKVSVIIPTRNGVDLLRRCIDSVRERSTYRDLELIVIDNQSDDPETLEYLATFGGRVVRYPHRFNYARMMNLASWTADTDQLLFLNNDTEVIDPDWVEALLEHAQRPEVGAVGCRLYYPNGAPQHEGVIVNYAGGAAGNVNFGGWQGFGDIVRDCTAVTGAVTMMRPSVFFEIGGFEERLRVAFNDVDLCLRVRQAGYRVVYTPYATLFHHESATRGFVPHPEDDDFFDRRWEPRSERFHDPYYNPHLSRSYPFKVYS